MYHLEFRLALFLLLGVSLLSMILSQCEALQTKQSTLEMKIPDISFGFFANDINWLIRTIHCCHLLRIQGVCTFITEFFR